jgi:hypothetical protein
MTADDLSDLVIENKGQLETVRKLATSKCGRPRKPDAEKLSKKITLNLTQKEYEALQQKAGVMPIAIFVKSVLKRSDCI